MRFDRVGVERKKLVFYSGKFFFFHVPLSILKSVSELHYHYAGT